MLLSLEITMFAVNRISKTFLVSLVLVTFVMTNLPEVFFKKRCSQKFHKIDRKTPVPETLFNKVAGLRPATLLKKSLWHRCFPVNFVKFLRNLFQRASPDDCFQKTKICFKTKTKICFYVDFNQYVNICLFDQYLFLDYKLQIDVK